MSAILRTVRLQAAARTRSMASQAELKATQKRMGAQSYNLSHGKDLPTYMKGDSDKMVNVAVLGVTALGFVLSMRGFYNMSFGINKS